MTRAPPSAGWLIHTSLPDAKGLEIESVSAPLCGEGQGVGVVQKGPPGSILSHPHLRLLPARGRRERHGERRVKIVALRGRAEP
jgi:hypothetical protein